MPVFLLNNTKKTSGGVFRVDKTSCLYYNSRNKGSAFLSPEDYILHINEVFMNFFKSKRRALIIGIDFLIFTFTYLFTILLTLISSGNNGILLSSYAISFAVALFCVFVFRFIIKVYSNVWRYANSKAFISLVIADAAGGAVAVFISWLPVSESFDIGGWCILAFITMADVATLMSRFCYQILYQSSNVKVEGERNNKIGVAIVGAGQVGAILAEDLLYNPSSHYYPVCFIDKDKNKIGNRVCGINVIDESDDVIEKIKKLPVQEIFIALTNLTAERATEIHSRYAKTGCKIKLYDIPVVEAENTDGKRVIREVKIEDLLFRDSIKVADDKTKEFYLNKVVLVTGGGGSIGSELCRQIARCSPKKLIVFDIYENNAYDLQQELRYEHKDTLDLVVEIGSVRDRARLEAVFSEYRPEIVLHAAAHKHVPLMEHSSCEAIKNNVFGTYNTADMAEKYGVKKFILISTDKAVNPTNVMGASKRLCEMVVQCRRDSSTSFAAVRFGNVLGSNGSVIPLFRRQIEHGGPVTITDKRIIRYFMTIPEASGLVMQAGAMARGGDLFVLDMGKPIKILDLAENMIRLSGKTPYVDIDIVETGLRPGEKLYEELLMKNESLDKTENDLIFIERDNPHSREYIEDVMDKLREVIKNTQNQIASPSIKEVMKSVVPTFRDPDEINKAAECCEEMKIASGT